MKRIGIIGFQGIACAFAAAAIQKLQDKGIDIDAMSYRELEGAALADPPIDFPIYVAPSAAPARQVFKGYMKRANRYRY